MLKKLGPNQTQINQNGYLILFSYETPVAVRHCASGQEWHTEKRHSNTTSRHINAWKSDESTPVSQETIEKIVNKGHTAI